MKIFENQWLHLESWATIETINQNLCRAQRLESQDFNLEKAREHWQKHVFRVMTLPAALDVCRKCNHLQPFVFHNGNTFGTFVKDLIHDFAQTLPSVEGQNLKTTLAHYVNCQTNRRELLRLLEFFAGSWDNFHARVVPIAPARLTELSAEPIRELIAS